MKYLVYMVLVLIATYPQTASAVGELEHQYTSRASIAFSPETVAAFDRSGRFTTRRTLADGATITELNGSMGSVTVARLAPDGKVETYCSGGKESSISWMAGEFDTRPAEAYIAPERVK